MDTKTLMIVGALMLAATGSFMAFQQDSVEQFTTQFESFKFNHAKSYATAEEEAYRFAVYVQNIQMINEHNAKEGETYTMAENHMADLTQEEFEATYLGYKPTEPEGPREVYYSETFVGDVNWVTAGKVQHVKDQGQCGSCWAFSAVAATESSEAVHKDHLGNFSEQQLVDCSRSYGNNGCNGGLMDYAFRYFKDHGICSEDSYGYTARDGTCKVEQCTKSEFKISGYTDVSRGSTSALKSMCDKQPVSIAVDARRWSFYSGGVFSNCGSSLDHGVLLAGYSADHWLVKNSWGTGWGENGYIRLAPGNTCALANAASIPKI